MYDLVSLGEVMLRMSPPGHERLRRTRSLDVHVAGSQLNVAADLARLGKKTAFVSRLPDNALGLLALDACRSYGVDMQHVKLVPGSRMGINYLEFTATPRVSAIVYDRAGSAASHITPDDFDWRGILKDARFAYTDGIFPGLGDGCRETALQFLTVAKELGCTTCFDVNYREHLWTEERAREAWQKLLPYVDVVVTNRSVSGAVFGYRGTDSEIMSSYARDFGCPLVCLTSRETFGILRGAWSSQALSRGQGSGIGDRGHRQTLTPDPRPLTPTLGKRFEFDIIDRFGTGDAFLAGFLYGYMQGDVQYALDFGDALCGMAHTIEGDVAHVSVAEVEALLSDDYDFNVRR